MRITGYCVTCRREVHALKAERFDVNQCTRYAAFCHGEVQVRMVSDFDIAREGPDARLQLVFFAPPDENEAASPPIADERSDPIAARFRNLDL